MLHARRLALSAPAGVLLLERRLGSAPDFMAILARRWGAARAPVSTHLVGDDLLALLWRAGVRTVPVVHNAQAGWRNDPRAWNSRHVPLAVACAAAVRAELYQHECAVPVLTLRHARLDRGVDDAIEFAQAGAVENAAGDDQHGVAPCGQVGQHRDGARVVLLRFDCAQRQHHQGIGANAGFGTHPLAHRGIRRGGRHGGAMA